MIDYPNQELDRPGPAAVPGVPDDIVYLGDALKEIAHWTRKVYDALRRQESPNPTIIDLSTPGATGPATVYQTTARIRCEYLIFSSNFGSEEYALKIGSANRIRWWSSGTGGSGGPFAAVPMPIVLEPGVDVSVIDLTNAAHFTIDAYLVGYVELEDRP